MTSTSMRARSQATRQPRPSRDRVLWFVVLSLVFSWTPWTGVLVISGDPLSSGTTTALWALGGLGPALAAVIVAAMGSGGGTGVVRLLPGLGRRRLGRWYLLLLAGMPVAFAAVLLAALFDPVLLDLSGLAQWYLLPAFVVGGILFGGLEEVGWRGYLLPVLQQRSSALTASVGVGLVWSLWHAPLFLMEGTNQASASVVWFTVQAVALSVILAWAFNSTGGSLLLAVLAHGTLNGWYEAAARWLAPEVGPGFMPFSALLTAVLALIVIWRCGSTHLSSRTRHTWPT